MNRKIVAAIVSVAFTVSHAGTQNNASGSREVPAHTVPVPSTVSPQMQAIIAAPINANWKIFPKSAEEWNASKSGRRHHRSNSSSTA